MRKILFVLVATLFLFPCLRALATPYAVHCGGDHTLHLLDSDIEPTVGEMLNGQEITGVWTINLNNSGTFTSPWRAASEATKVIIEKSFENVRPTSCCSWFASFRDLTDIEGLEYLNTGDVTNMKYMFCLCEKLTSIDLSHFDTTNLTYADSMFSNCSSLTSIDVSTFNTAKCTTMQGMFAGCTGLTSIDVSHFTTENVRDMSCMFRVCSGLTSLDLSNFNTENVKDMNNMFSGCTGLTSLELDNFVTTNVTDMRGMFMDCTGLTSLELDNFVTTKVTKMGSMFSGCTGLTALTLDNFVTANVTDMSGMFKDCSGLSALSLDNFNTAKVTDMSSMFSGCSGLTELMLDNFDTSNVINMSSMFFNCYNMISLDLSNFNTVKVTNMQFMFSGLGSLTSIILNSFDTSSVTDMRQMFSRCGVTSLDLSSFSTGKVTNMYALFGGCFSLTNLDLSSFNTASVTDMAEMFCSCSNLTNLDLSNFNTEKVTKMGSMFDGCSNLTNLDLSSFNTASVTDMAEMFLSCRNLTTLDLSKFSTAIIYSNHMNNMFTGCGNLRMVLFGEALDDFTKLNDVLPQNAMVFVDEGTTVPEGRANIVLGDKCEHLTINYGGDNQLYWFAPRDFTADKVTINRVFIQGRPYTLYMPFAMDATQYGTFYSGGKLNKDGDEVTFSMVTDAQTTPDIPYMFIPKEGFTRGITIEGPVIVTNLTGETAADGLQGVAEKKVFTADEAAQKIYYGWAGGEFCWADEGATVDACRAYFRLPASASAKAPAVLRASFGDNEGTTGIDAIEGDGNDSPAYNISGQRVDGSYRGIVIKKGSKTSNFNLK